jgi:hypothetical protein
MLVPLKLPSPPRVEFRQPTVFVGSRPAVAYWLSRPQLNNPTGADGGVVAADPMVTEGPVKGVACTALHSQQRNKIMND